MLIFKCPYSYELDSKSCSSASLSQHFFRYLGFGIILYNREILVKSIMREKRVSKSDKEKEKGRNTQQRYTSEYLLKVNPKIKEIKRANMRQRSVVISKTSRPVFSIENKRNYFKI